MIQNLITIAIIILSYFQISARGNASEFMCNYGRRLVTQEALIVSGHKSRDGDWPWHTIINHLDASVKSFVYMCGGTLLNSNSILTAAHCVYESGRPIVSGRISIQLGRHSRHISGLHSQEIAAFEVVPHEHFNANTLSNDIAIIRLATEAYFTDYVQPVCLWDSSKTDVSEVVGKNGTVIGFGITEQNEISYSLREATIPVVSRETCIESDPTFYSDRLTDYVFCAGLRNGTTACNGDSGGSLTFEENGVYRIRGIVSLTKVRDGVDRRLCKTDQYVVFTDVAKYLDWIIEKVPSLSSPFAACRSPNEEYAVDPKRPQNTCETYGCYGESRCPGSSDSGECYCKEGYARSFPEGLCISTKDPQCAKKVPPTPEDCSKRVNEVFNEFVSPRQHCENTCEKYEVNCSTVNTEAVVWGPWCDCKKGYARLQNGKCVDIYDDRCYALYKPSKEQCRLRGESYGVEVTCTTSNSSCEYPNGPKLVCLTTDKVNELLKCDCHTYKSKGESSSSSTLSNKGNFISHYGTDHNIPLYIMMLAAILAFVRYWFRSSIPKIVYQNHPSIELNERNKVTPLSSVEVHSIPSTPITVSHPVRFNDQISLSNVVHYV